MEESVKRRERLKAMREAAQSDLNTDVQNCTQTQGLSNPLIETSATNLDGRTPQRFNYYTDPMSALSGNKRSKVSPNISQEIFTPTMQQKTVMVPPEELPSEIMHQRQETICSPMGTVDPPGMQPGTAHGSWNGFGNMVGYNVPSNSPIGANFLNRASYGQGGSPILSPGWGHGQWFRNSPGTYSGQGDISSIVHQDGPGFSPREGRRNWSNINQTPVPVHGCSPNFGPGARPNYNSGQGRGYGSSNSPSPGPGHGNSPSSGQGGTPPISSAQGRGRWPRNSHTPGSGYGPNVGRGRGQWSDNNAADTAHSRGRGINGRGRGPHGNLSAEHNAELYYNKSMVEDPWKFLTPVIWKREDYSTKSFDSSKSWLPKSITTQRDKVSEGSSQSQSQPSLAEYLAASFNKAIKNEHSHDESGVS